MNSIRRRCEGSAILAPSTNVVTYLLIYLATILQTAHCGGGALCPNSLNDKT